MQLLNTAAYLEEKEVASSEFLKDNWGNVYRGVLRAADPRIKDRKKRGDSVLWDSFRDFANKMICEFGEPSAFYEDGHANTEAEPSGD